MRSVPYVLFVITLLSMSLQAAGPAQQTKTAKTKHGQTTHAAQPFRIFNPDTMAKPAAGYSQVAEVTDGKIVYIAGQVALDRSGNLVGKDDFRAQAQQVFENLNAAVEAAGGDFNSVIKLNYYCSENVDPAQLPVVREIRDKYVNTANPPTSTFVVVKRLVRQEWLIEVEAVAVVKK
ncbi:MAG TPA: RidA family protein [Candidatus Solibacter sp.]|jgi:enamine deaminase RidA (YjgF/YER057c/UK114 family)|nr:RidA family protein [Candidatus Solibacter sp.]